MENNNLNKWQRYYINYTVPFVLFTMFIITPTAAIVLFAINKHSRISNNKKYSNVVNNIYNKNEIRIIPVVCDKYEGNTIAIRMIDNINDTVYLNNDILYIEKVYSVDIDYLNKNIIYEVTKISNNKYSKIILIDTVNKEYKYYYILSINAVIKNNNL